MNIIRIRDLATELVIDDNKLIPIDDNNYPSNAKKMSVGKLGQYYATHFSLVYTNTGQTLITLGGIQVGSTFSGKTMQQMWDMLLYPQLFPSFSSFTFQFYPGPHEVGFSFTGDTAKWETLLSPQQVVPNTLEISGYNLTTLTGLIDNQTHDLIFTGVVTYSIASGHTWTIREKDIYSNIFSRSLTIDWYWLLYWGNSPTDSTPEIPVNVDPTTLTGGGTVITDLCLGAYSFGGGDYKYFFIEQSSQGVPTTFKDQLSSLGVAMNSPYLQSVTNAYSQTTNYYVYRSTNKLNGQITIIIE